MFCRLYDDWRNDPLAVGEKLQNSISTVLYLKVNIMTIGPEFPLSEMMLPTQYFFSFLQRKPKFLEGNSRFNELLNEQNIYQIQE